MDAALAASIAEIMKLGFAGAIIVAEAIVIVILYRAKEKQTEDRFADVKQTTAVLTKASESMDTSAEAIKGVQNSLQNLVNVLERRR